MRATAAAPALKPQFIIHPEGLNRQPSVRLVTEDLPTEKLEGAIVRPLKLCKDSQPIFQRTRGMEPSIDCILTGLCLAGWQMRAKPMECEPKKDQWHVQVMTTTVGLQSFAFPFYVGNDGMLGIASPFAGKGDSVVRARLQLDWVEPDRLPYAGFFGPLRTMKFDRTIGLYMLACNAIMAGWDQ